MSEVAILCASPVSYYHQMDGVDVYDQARDARTFDMSSPVVAHPPCRAWSAFLEHQAKPEPSEKDLGLWCCEVLKLCGGVLEHPAHSRLFQAAGLPLPMQTKGHLWTIQVDQRWWGYICKKATWLCFSHVPKEVVDVPLRLVSSKRTADWKRWKRLSKHQRAATCPAMAEWLVERARETGRASHRGGQR